MSSRYFSQSFSISCIWCLMICNSIRPCFGVVFPRSDSSVESYSNSNDIGTGSSSSSEGNIRFDTTDSLNEEAREHSDDDDARTKGWNYLDSKKPWTPHEKTISLQFLDDDGQFTHRPPAWPHDEYLLQFPYNTNFNGLTNTKNGSGQSESEGLNQPSESEKDYEWTRLRPRPPKGMFIGPGFYDDSNKYAAEPSTNQAITDGTSSSSASASAGTGGVANSASESANHGKFYNSQAYDQYRRKRLRLKIHPGLLAAPIAGFAAYKAVSAFASKPLLFELGWVNNKPEHGIGGGGGGGWGWNGPIWNGGGGGPVYPPYYPPILPVNPYPTYPVGNFPRPGIGALQPQYPILRPTRNEATKSSWWNPFSALTPRFRSKKERKNCCA